MAHDRHPRRPAAVHADLVRLGRLGDRRVRRPPSEAEPEPRREPSGLVPHRERREWRRVRHDRGHGSVRPGLPRGRQNPAIPGEVGGDDRSPLGGAGPVGAALFDADPDHPEPRPSRRRLKVTDLMADVAPAVAELDTIVSLSKRRGFIFPSSEIYGGINAVWDYGPLGVELKNNVKRAWWKAMVQERDDIVGLDSGILMHPRVWVTSGHVGSFSDPLVECQTDHRRFRLDELPGAENLSPSELADPGIVERLGLKCPVDGGPLSAPRRFNLMFQTHMGPVEDEGSVIYLRPETAQGSYVNFRNVQQSSRKKVPFGIAQIGKSFRNEISPGNFVFRMREFEQMEMQYFVHPGDEAAERFEEWLPRRRGWYERYGVTQARLRTREHRPDELAHYAKKAVDVEYRFPFGWKELEGVHNRGDFDLSRHQEASGQSLDYFDPATNEAFVPWIVETAAGADRA